MRPAVSRNENETVERFYFKFIIDTILQIEWPYIKPIEFIAVIVFGS